MSLEDKIPRVNFPETSGRYKIIQIDLDGEPFIRYASLPMEKRFAETHPAILINLLRLLGIPYNEIVGKSDLKIPSLHSGRYIVQGMGISDVNVEQKIASFGGTSFDYEIGINLEHLNLIKPLVPDWRIFDSLSRQ